jgi:hypothetical protein
MDIYYKLTVILYKGRLIFFRGCSISLLDGFTVYVPMLWGFIDFLIGAWAIEVVKRGKTIPRNGIFLAVCTLWLINSLFTAMYAYLSPPPANLFLNEIYLVICFSILSLIVTYTLLKKKLISNRILIPIFSTLYVPPFISFFRRLARWRLFTWQRASSDSLRNSFPIANRHSCYWLFEEKDSFC